MYFNNEKEDTNIDKEFKNNKKSKIELDGFKKPLIILGGVVLLLIIVLIIFFSTRGSGTEYFITLEGGEVITIYKNGVYNEPGYTGFDSKRNNLTDDVVVDNDVDTSSVGEYTITYKLKNIVKERTVKVIDRPKEGISIFLYGDKTITMNVGDIYNEPGYKAIDNFDGDVTSKVDVTNNVNTSKAGNYKIIYTVTNSSGITETVVRTVIVK